MMMQILGTFLAVSALSVVLGCPKKQLPYAGLVGALGGTVYLVSDYFGLGAVSASFLSVISVAMLSHMFARILKTPVTVYLVAGILPTVPGTGMYRTVYYMIAGDRAMSSRYLIETLEVAGAIALAIFLVDALMRVFKKLQVF